MDVNTIIQIINGVGFPIAACIAMGAFIVWDKVSRQKSRKEDIEKQDELLSKLTSTVDNNTKVIQQIADKLGINE